MTTLPEVVWRAMPFAFSATNGGEHRYWVAHAIRNNYALCGMNARRFTWENKPDADRCPRCVAIPDGYAFATDMTALGLTYRQLDYWCRKGYLRVLNPDPGSGARRLFPPGEYELLATMAQYVAAGVSPDAAAKAARRGGVLTPGVRLVIDEDIPMAVTA